MAAGCATRISDRKPRGESHGTIVLLHGYLESLDVWDSFMPLLDRRFRVVAVDLPGHGISEVKGPLHTMEFLAEIVAGTLDELGIEKCTLIGHSMGGYASLEFLRKYPDRLDGFVLFHSTPNPDSSQKKEQREREIAIVESGKKDLLASTAANGFASDNRLRFANEIEDLAEQIILTDDYGITALLRGMMQRKDTNEVMRKSPVPQMIILGRKDEYITPDVAEKLIAAQPQAIIVWLDESGHMGFIEEAEKSAEAISGFMESQKLR